MSHPPPLEATTATKTTPSALVTNSELERFFGNCGDDTRRKIFSHLGLPKRRKRPWAEVWNAMGLEPEQPEVMWDDLTLGSNGKNVLWNAAQVAERTGLAASTVNDYCRKKRFPEDFPRPLINAGPKTRLWLPLEVRAYNVPSIYGVRALMIRRKAKRSGAQKKAVPVFCTRTMQPLPPKA